MDYDEYCLFKTVEYLYQIFLKDKKYQHQVIRANFHPDFFPFTEVKYKQILNNLESPNYNAITQKRSHTDVQLELTTDYQIERQVNPYFDYYEYHYGDFDAENPTLFIQLKNKFFELYDSLKEKEFNSKQFKNNEVNSEPSRSIKSPLSKPKYVERDGVGFIVFHDQKEIRIGKANNQSTKLVKSLMEPEIGLHKPTENVFQQFRTKRGNYSKNDTALALEEKVKKMNDAFKENQREGKLEKTIKFKHSDDYRQVWLEFTP